MANRKATKNLFHYKSKGNSHTDTSVNSDQKKCETRWVQWRTARRGDRSLSQSKLPNIIK